MSWNTFKKRIVINSPLESVYWRSVRFKMDPGHEKDMYYEDDEQWPVHRYSLNTGLTKTE
jgi:hypothetical protein